MGSSKKYLHSYIQIKVRTMVKINIKLRITQSIRLPKRKSKNPKSIQLINNKKVTYSKENRIERSNKLIPKFQLNSSKKNK